MVLPPVDLEAASPLSFSSTSAHVPNSLTFCLALVTTFIRVKHVAFLTIIGSLFLGLYIFNQLPLSFDTSKMTPFPFSASQDDNIDTGLETIGLLLPISCTLSLTPFLLVFES